MIYPDDYDCLICKKRYYGCKHGKVKTMLSCVDFVPRDFSNVKVPSLALYRCLFGLCAAVWRDRLLRKSQSSK